MNDWDHMIKRIKSSVDESDESDEVLDNQYFTGLENFFLSQKEILESYFSFSAGCHAILRNGATENADFPFEKPAIHDALDAILTEFEKWILNIFWEQIYDIGREIYPTRKITDEEIFGGLLRIIKKNKKIGEIK